MQTISTEYSSAINSKRRVVRAKIDCFFNDGEYKTTYTEKDIIDIEIQRTGEDSKFFGFGVPQKVIFKLLDSQGLLNIQLGYGFKVYIGVELEDGTIEYKSFPRVYVTEVSRDIATNVITITAWDKIYPTAEHTVEEINIIAPYTLKQYAEAAAFVVDGVDRSQGTEEESYSHTIVWDADYNDMYLDGTVWSLSEDGNIVLNYAYSTRYTAEILLNLGSYSNPNGFTFDTTKKYILRAEVVSGRGTPTTNYPITLSDGRTEYIWNTAVQEFEIPEETKIRGFNELWITSALSTTYTDFEMKFTIELAAEEKEKVDPLFLNENNPALSLTYEMGANLEGNETIREILNAIAEATQSIYYIGGDDLLHFKQLEPKKSIYSATADKDITKDIYMSLSVGNRFALNEIISATELGDNISVPVDVYDNVSDYLVEEVSQQVRNNPFWELREDIDSIVEDAAIEAADLYCYKFDCQWRGDPALEIGDSLLIGESTRFVYLLNDTLKYNGGLSQKTEWNYSVTSSENINANPSNLGEVLKQTYAKVDKQNKEIELLVSEQSATNEAVASLQLNTEAITASVTKVEQVANDAIGVLNEDIYTLTKKVETSMTAEDVQIQIKSELSNGVDKVTTATGFTFNEDGLTIAKTGSEMTTNIDEDGMSVFRGGEEVLTADNTGVTAFNLHARTYLIVGETSRFEDFTSASGEKRTGCFWIGG